MPVTPTTPIGAFPIPAANAEDNAVAIRTAIGAAATSHTHVAAAISDSTDAGRNLITLANPVDVRYIKITAGGGITLLTQAQLLAEVVTGGSITNSMLAAMPARTIKARTGFANGTPINATFEDIQAEMLNSQLTINGSTTPVINSPLIESGVGLEGERNWYGASTGQEIAMFRDGLWWFILIEAGVRYGWSTTYVGEEPWLASWTPDLYSGSSGPSGVFTDSAGTGTPSFDLQRFALRPLNSGTTSLTRNLDGRPDDTPVVDYIGPANALSIISGSVSVNALLGRSQKITLTADVTSFQVPTNLEDGQSMSISGSQDGTGGRAFNLDSGYIIVGGGLEADISSLTANKKFLIAIIRRGSDYFASIITE